MNRKSFILSALALMAATPALAQAIPATVDQPVEITFYNYNLASAGLGADATRKMIAEFEALEPNVKVNGVGVNSAEMNSRIQADIAAGRAPDVAQVVFDGLSYVAENLGAQVLEDLVPADDLAAHFEGMSPNGLKLGVIDGRTYALAYTFSTPVLFYNADLFKAAGLDPDKPPHTWAEVKQAALTIQEKTDAQGFEGALVGAGGSSSDTFLQALILSNGGRAMSEDRKTLSFAEPPAVEAIAMLRDLAKAGVLPNDSLNVSLDKMSSGKLGMYLTSSVLQRPMLAASKDKFELRASYLPGFGDKQSVPVNTGSGLVIFSQDPLKQRAAWDFMKFLTSKRGYTIITAEIGYLPLRTDIVNDPEYLKPWADQYRGLVEPNLEQLSRLQPWVSYPGTNYRQILKTVADAAEQAVFGDSDDVAGILGAAQ